MLCLISIKFFVDDTYSKTIFVNKSYEEVCDFITIPGYISVCH